MNVLARWLSSVVIGFAMAIVIVTVAVLPFMTPQWISFEQGRANATGWTGYTTDELRAATESILADLVVGPPAFDVEVRGEPVLVERERGHMRDVRSVFVGLWILAILSFGVLVVGVIRLDRRSTWLAVRRGSLTLAAAVVALGVVALVAFDRLFELFHQVFFPAGSYTFDPTTERLVQLFPFQFWQETAVVVGIVAIVVALGVATVSGRRAPASGRRDSTIDLSATPEPSR